LNKKMKLSITKKSHWCTAVIHALLVTSLYMQGAEPLSGRNQKAVSEGAVGAGEGPAWDGHDSLYFTNEQQITRRDSNGKFHVFRKPSNDANGILFDFVGRPVICEGAGRRVIRLERDGKITVLADKYESRRFNSPNDLTIDSKGRIYFSDPRYGPRNDMELRDRQGRTFEGVYRIDAPGKVIRVIGHEVERANGVLVSPRDEFLYVADNNNNKVGGARKLWRFKLRDDGTVDAASRTLIFDWGTGRGPDGLKLDREGRLYVAAGLNRPHLPFETADKFKGGIYVLAPDGKLLNFIAIPVDEVTNCAFGDPDRMTLFITAGGTLWHTRVTIPGWVPQPQDAPNASH
jgi:gluconolactonase